MRCWYYATFRCFPSTPLSSSTEVGNVTCGVFQTKLNSSELLYCQSNNALWWILYSLYLVLCGHVKPSTSSLLPIHIYPCLFCKIVIYPIFPGTGKTRVDVSNSPEWPKTASLHSLMAKMLLLFNKKYLALPLHKFGKHELYFFLLREDFGSVFRIYLYWIQQ